VVDLTTAAIPIYFGGMGLEYRALKRRAERLGAQPSDYERRDTVASLAMGVGSLVAPIALAKLLAPITPGKGRYGKALVGLAVGAVAATTIADAVNRRRPASRWARKVAEAGGVASVVTGGIAITTAFSAVTKPQRVWHRRRSRRDLGTGVGTVLAAVLAWDFIYYWSHRLQHESRYMWAIHVVHHSSERYNLSTALRQPVADAFGTFPPYAVMCLAGIRPSLIETARGVNLIYQYWIHTDTIKRIGALEQVLNTPSHHRVHHGSNPEYIDRNHGSILIVWDKLFGTFEPEREPVVYGLTKNIDTFSPARIAIHEHRDILRDVAQSTSWRERLSYVVRGPGWAYARHKERGDAEPAGVS